MDGNSEDVVGEEKMLVECLDFPTLSIPYNVSLLFYFLLLILIFFNFIKVIFVLISIMSSILSIIFFDCRKF